MSDTDHIPVVKGGQAHTDHEIEAGVFIFAMICAPIAAIIL